MLKSALALKVPLSPLQLRRVRRWLLVWPLGLLLGRPLQSLLLLLSPSPAAGSRARAALRSASARMSQSLLALRYSSQWVALSVALSVAQSVAQSVAS
jgi:hypothetical protein